ncbi:MAG: hypothetical protein OJJ21_18345, partial [Ferrovibrio sp.]|uniref:hypothetical protein n=1 Tax=Ferrovibrio sp. TaxID=1917215 RepID=UPI00262D1F69
HGKDFADTGSFGDVSSEATAGNTDMLQARPAAVTQAEQSNAKSEQSLQFNAWLDRTVPLLQQYLAGSTTGAVTSPGSKPKH